MPDGKPNGNIMRALTGALVAVPVIGGAVTLGQSMGDADATRRDVTRLQDRVAQLNDDVTDLESRVRVLRVRLERLRTDDTDQGPHQ